MPIDNFESTRLQTNWVNGGGGIPSDPGPYIGIVMDNVDPLRNGRIRVWLKSRGALDKNDEANWRTLNYLSPFFGTTPHADHDTENPKEYHNAHSYGMWFTSPDVGVEVVCIFVNGDPNLGYFIGYVPEPQMNHMVPATGARDNGDPAMTEGAQTSAYSRAKRLPVTEINKSKSNMNNADFYNVEKPVNAVLSSQMWKQGTITDRIRGPIGSSAQRESPSYTYGISTPGRAVYSAPEINNGVESRRGGHSITMDDGDIKDDDILMRFRTGSGHQITMSDDGQVIYIQHANGESWIELGNEGTIDLYGTNSINLRTKGELNFHADSNINFFSGKNINMFAKENIKIESDQILDLTGKKTLTAYSEKLLTLKSEGDLSSQSGKLTTVKASDDIIVEGKRIYLNAKKAYEVTKTVPITPTLLPDSILMGSSGWASFDRYLKSVVSRAPTHEPYVEHNKGVAVFVKNDDPLAPATPTATPSATTNKIVDVATMPPIDNPIQTANVIKDSNETTGIRPIGDMSEPVVMAVMSQHADTLGNNPADASFDLDVVNLTTEELTVHTKSRKVIKIQTDIITTQGSRVLGLTFDSLKGIGKYGIQPPTLEDIKIIKPGALATAKTAKEMYNKLSDPALFSGLNGAKDLKSLADTAMQTDIVQSGMNLAFDSLNLNGVMGDIKGAQETATIIGTSLVAGAVTITGWLKDDIPSAVSGLMDDVAKGSFFAASLAKGSAVLESALAKVAIPKQIISAINNIDSSSMFIFVDDLVDNIKIPSISINKVGDLIVGDVLDNALGIVTDEIERATQTLSSIRDSVTSLGKTIANIENTSIDSITKLATNLTGDLVSDVAGNLSIDKVGSMAQSIAGDQLSKYMPKASNLLTAAGKVIDKGIGGIGSDLVSTATNQIGSVVDTAKNQLGSVMDNTLNIAKSQAGRLVAGADATIGLVGKVSKSINRITEYT